MDKKHLIVWDIEWYSNKFHFLLANPALQEVSERIHLILIWDIVWDGPGRMNMLRYCFERQERVTMILWNKDLLAQRLIGWEKIHRRIPNWATKFIQELEAENNPELMEFFMNGFIHHMEVWQRFLISHMRPIEGKKLKKHSPDEIVWNHHPENRPYKRKWKIMIYGHEANMWVRINKNRSDGWVASIWIDSWCGKWNNLSWILITRNAQHARIVDSGWTNIRIDL